MGPERYFGPCFHLFCPLAAGVPPSKGMDRASCIEIPRESQGAARNLQPGSPEPEAERLTPLRYLFQERLHACLSLLGGDDLRAKLENAGTMADELRRMLVLLSALEEQLPALTALVGTMPQAKDILGSASPDPAEEQPDEELMQMMGALHGHSERLIARVQGVPYPFAAGPASVATYLAKDPPSVRGPMYELVRAQEIVGRIAGLYARALGRIAKHAEQVERVVLEAPVAPTARL